MEEYTVNNKTYRVNDNHYNKTVQGPDYSFIFNKYTGAFVRWGITSSHDPLFAPFAPEIADIEITSICSHGCKFCYKNNTAKGRNMSLSTFKKLINKFPKSLCQVALGADSTGTTNPDLFDIAKYCRSIDVIPNITLANVSDTVADKVVNVMGAVAVSYTNKDTCYDSIQRLTSRGLKQTNMHYMLSNETYYQCLDVIKDIQFDPRLSKLNAIVFLSLKKMGRGETFTPLSQDKFHNIIRMCMDNSINFVY